jgi:hypothetical protein
VVSAAEDLGFAEKISRKSRWLWAKPAPTSSSTLISQNALRDEIELWVESFPDRLEITVVDYSTINFPVDETPGVALDEYIDTQRRRGWACTSSAPLSITSNIVYLRQR